MGQGKGKLHSSQSSLKASVWRKVEFSVLESFVRHFSHGESSSSACAYAQSLSCVRLFAASWTVAHQATLSLGFPRQEERSSQEERIATSYSRGILLT